MTSVNIIHIMHVATKAMHTRRDTMITRIQSCTRTHRRPCEGLTLKMLREPGRGDARGGGTGCGGTVKVVLGAVSKGEQPAALQATSLKYQEVPAGARKQCLVPAGTSNTSTASWKLELCALLPV